MKHLSFLTVLTLSLLLISAAAAIPALADGEKSDNEIPPMLINLYLEAQDAAAQDEAESGGEWPWQTADVGVGIDPVG